MAASQLEDDGLDVDLVRLDPAPALSRPEFAASLGALSERLRDEQLRDTTWRELRRPTSRMRSRRIRWTVLGLILAVAVAFGAAPAAAAVSRLLAHTGLFGTNFSTTRAGAQGGTDGDKSEWIDLKATDAGKALAALYPSYLVLPRGVTKVDAIETIIRLNSASVSQGDAGRSTEVVEQAVGIHESYEFFANCAWYSAWLTADSSGDSTSLAADSAGLTTAARFPALASTSPDVTKRLVTFATDAASGNRADIEEASKELDCTEMLKGSGE
ncbi:MAG TPA: hypothetical protein VHZ81_01675 [Galbitalea sp.]|jgi:hypothetical protein|nr:hypothetical protein [Galbitalea sp.]